MNKKIIKLFSGLAVAALLLAACGGGTTATVNKVGMVTDSGGANDKSFNQGTYEGIKKFVSEHKDTWTASNPIESANVQAIKPNLIAAASKNNVVAAAGYLFTASLLEVAKDNQDVKFIGIDIDVSNQKDVSKNLQTYIFAEEQAGYVAGIAAAKQTKTKKVGYLGGEQVPAVEKFGYGFIAGVQSVDPTIGITYEYTGSFKDSPLGAQKTLSMYNNGIDVVFVAAGETGVGVISETIKQVEAGKDVWVIGVDRDQYDDGKIPGKDKSVILTSAVKKVDVATETALKEINDGTFTGGKTVMLSMKDDAVGVPKTNPNLSGDISTALAAAEAKIKSGEIVVPDTKSKLNLTGVVGTV
ncbi:MAG: BMP family lipoprotein [Culicoidibacterales bacterium]